MQNRKNLIQLYICAYKLIPRGLQRTLSCYVCKPDLTLSGFSQQTRTFRTRSHSIGSVGLGKDGFTSGEVDSSLQRRFNLFKGKNSDKFKEQVEAERIKQILNDSKVKEEDKQQLKIAFAEGYFTAYGKNRFSSRSRIFQMLRDSLAVVFIAIFAFSLLGEMTGNPYRRIFLNTKSEVSPEDINVTFDDVRGIGEAKLELQEVVEFLKNPAKFSRLGGKLPKGVLLLGPPGTGKTLLARAVAGEAGVPFFHAAGPEFDELLVGQGARRVRDLFAAAKQRAPCVIFIDEIDSIGSKRTSSMFHPYANQTINQLLTELDGFHQNEGIIVIGATNRRQDLDKALTRPGRFDVEVIVPVPDIAGRMEILDFYLKKIKLSEKIDISTLARQTIGFTGADIENLCNQAALRAAIENASGVTMQHLEGARDKITMGPKRLKKIPDEETNRLTAYHEAGHALVSFFTKDSLPVHKVTIVSRGYSLGHTSYIPTKEQFQRTKSQMLATIDSAMGGLVAEEIIFGKDKITSGASEDIKRATDLATRMVRFYGMSEALGPRFYLRRNSYNQHDLSDKTLEAIDTEIKTILQHSHDRAKQILEENKDILHAIAHALLQFETLKAEQVKALIDRIKSDRGKNTLNTAQNGLPNTGSKTEQQVSPNINQQQQKQQQPLQQPQPQIKSQVVM